MTSATCSTQSVGKPASDGWRPIRISFKMPACRPHQLDAELRYQVLGCTSPHDGGYRTECRLAASGSRTGQNCQLLAAITRPECAYVEILRRVGDRQMLDSMLAARSSRRGRLAREGWCILRTALPTETLGALDADHAPVFATPPFCQGSYYSKTTGKVRSPARTLAAPSGTGRARRGGGGARALVRLHPAQRRPSDRDSSGRAGADAAS